MKKGTTSYDDDDDYMEAAQDPPAAPHEVSSHTHGGGIERVKG